MQLLGFDFAPLPTLLGVAALIAGFLLLLLRLRYLKGGKTQASWLHVMSLFTLFLTFDLVLFGAFTRLSDSGLGCPDWPGCYGDASPLGAYAEIAQAQSNMPDGPVTHTKAWIEMIHRYLASGVGLMIAALMVIGWRDRLKLADPSMHRVSYAVSPWLPTLTFVWVCLQGLFGALTVTMKLFPLIVSLHLLGAYGLLALLTVLSVLSQPIQSRALTNPDFSDYQLLTPKFMLALWLGVGVLLLQAASGAWVSTNYAVLACTEFPKCQGSWWPAMHFSEGFTLWRHLGLNTEGNPLSFQALTAIHFIHRLSAGLATIVFVGLWWGLRNNAAFHLQRQLLGGLVLLQLLTGLSNVVLGWPMLAAIFHTGGAGALLVVLVWIIFTNRVAQARSTVP